MATQFQADRADENKDRALRDLIGLLTGRGYRFVTPTPATHARVIARADRRHATTIEDVLGWSLPFADDRLDRDALRLLRAAEAIEPHAGMWRSRLRVSSLSDRLFVHSAYPTIERDAVFFGPDSYRFADFIAAELSREPVAAGARMADIGTGAGVGAAILGAHCADAELLATDPNGEALRLARLNLAAGGLGARFIHASGLAGVPKPLDIVTINPPFILDDGGRAYRDGGGMHGAALSIDLAREAMAALAPGGRLLLYTGSAIVHGHDRLHEALTATARERGCTLRYRELDPDVFGEELDAPGYAEVDRIAAVGVAITRGVR